jgi:iron(II)-dependent oxidoreductase
VRLAGHAALAAPTRRSVIELLAEARARTLLIVSPLLGEQMQRRPEPTVEPVLTALSGIIHFEQHWLLDHRTYRQVESYDEWFDAMMDVRQSVLDRLDVGGVDPVPAAERYHMVIEHEYRQNEAIFETLQSLGDPYRAPYHRSLPPGRALADPGYMTRFAGGSVEIGTRSEPAVWPEEHPFHQREIEPFWIDVMPVTNADFMTFMASGAYQSRDLWSDDGWRWLDTSRVRRPGNWTRVIDGVWQGRWLGRERALDPGSPVGQVSYFEAEAFATFVGKRLPTELEWETAAAWDPEVQSRRNYPWGNMAPTLHVANLDQFALEPAPVGAFPGNISPIGCYGMIGDAWEWTSSAFLPYSPNGVMDELPVGRFDADARVLRGGSWSTRPGAIRVSTRRPASPSARHLFTGFRCARSA